MVPKSLIKLIDEAIIPAVALIVAKMLGLLAAVYFYDLRLTVQNGQIFKLLPSVHFPDYQQYITAENISNITMFTFAALGTALVLIRAHYFHESHISPKLHAKLAALNLENLVAPSFHLYHQAAIWMIFLWFTTVFLLLSSILKITYPQISAIGLIICANFSWIFILDIEKEVEISKQT